MQLLYLKGHNLSSLYFLKTRDLLLGVAQLSALLYAARIVLRPSLQHKGRKNEVFRLPSEKGKQLSSNGPLDTSGPSTWRGFFAQGLLNCALASEFNQRLDCIYTW